MDIRTQSSLLAAIVGLALGVSVLLRAQRPRVLTQFGAFAISVGAYYLTKFLEGLFPWDDGTLTGGAPGAGAPRSVSMRVPETRRSTRCRASRGDGPARSAPPAHRTGVKITAEPFALTPSTQSCARRG